MKTKLTLRSLIKQHCSIKIVHKAIHDERSCASAKAENHVLPCIGRKPVSEINGNEVDIAKLDRAALLNKNSAQGKA